MVHQSAKRAMNFFKVLSLTWATLLFVFLGATFEGVLFPVVDDFRLQKIDSNGDFGVVAAGSFEKLRDNCVFNEIKWFYGKKAGLAESNSVEVRAFFEDMPQIRAEGKQSFDRLVIRLDRVRLLENSYAYVYHTCHGAYLWRTKTLIYESKSRK